MIGERNRRYSFISEDNIPTYSMASNKKSAEFTDRIGSMVTNGFLTVGLAIGEEHGLWTALAEMDTPITSQQLADKVACKER